MTAGLATVCLDGSCAGAAEGGLADSRVLICGRCSAEEDAGVFSAGADGSFERGSAEGPPRFFLPFPSSRSARCSAWRTPLTAASSIWSPPSRSAWPPWAVSRSCPLSRSMPSSSPRRASSLGAACIFSLSFFCTVGFSFIFWMKYHLPQRGAGPRRAPPILHYPAATSLLFVIECVRIPLPATAQYPF